MGNEMRFIFTKIIMLELMLPYSGVLTAITLLNFGIGKNNFYPSLNLSGGLAFGGKERIEHRNNILLGEMSERFLIEKGKDVTF